MCNGIVVVALIMRQVSAAPTLMIAAGYLQKPLSCRTVAEGEIYIGKG